MAHATPTANPRPRRPARAALEWYWRKRFGLLLALLLVLIAVHPLLTTLAERSGRPAFRVGLVLLTGLLTVSLIALVAGLVRERTRWILLVVGLAYVAALGMGMLTGDLTFSTVGAGARSLACVLGIFACARRALKPGPVDTERIWAALDAYMLAGFALGAAYWTLEMVWPDSFGAPETSDLTQGKAVYFSFVTLATLGYGDIVPTSDVTRGLAVLEAVAGQGYLALLVARLVSLYGASDAPQPR